MQLHHPLAMMRPETNDSTLAAYSLPQDKAREGACRQATYSRTTSPLLKEYTLRCSPAKESVEGIRTTAEETVPASLELAFEIVAVCAVAVYELALCVL